MYVFIISVRHHVTPCTDILWHLTSSDDILRSVSYKLHTPAPPAPPAPPSPQPLRLAPFVVQCVVRVVQRVSQRARAVEAEAWLSVHLTAQHFRKLWTLGTTRCTVGIVTKDLVSKFITEYTEFYSIFEQFEHVQNVFRTMSYQREEKYSKWWLRR